MDDECLEREVSCVIIRNNGAIEVCGVVLRMVWGSTLCAMHSALHLTITSYNKPIT